MGPPGTHSDLSVAAPEPRDERPEGLGTVGTTETRDNLNLPIPGFRGDRPEDVEAVRSLGARGILSDAALGSSSGRLGDSGTVTAPRSSDDQPAVAESSAAPDALEDRHLATEGSAHLITAGTDWDARRRLTTSHPLCGPGPPATGGDMK